MHLYEAIQKTTWNEIEPYLTENCEALLIHLYEELYETLQKRPAPNGEIALPLSIMIENVPNSHAYDVYGIKEGDAFCYSLSLSTWDEWMQYSLKTEITQHFSLGEIIALCLWEMTYYGLKEEEVLQKRQEMMEVSEKLNKEYYKEEQITCPFCSGKRVKENNEMCVSCDEYGMITYITL